jgi:predicted molibdopterin-dependent oxidoreductase YjgC
MLVTLDEQQRIIRITGDPDNTATGGHVCLKGLCYARRVAYDDRLLTPLIRNARELTWPSLFIVFVAACGLVVDRFGFYALALQQTTEVEASRIDAAIELRAGLHKA